ncbi:MAG: hypothetical protein WCF77_03650 [Minisyncoccia bacterium]|jgi:hypothetical protein
MKELPLSLNERLPRTQEECRKIAEDVLARYQKEIAENRDRPVDGIEWWYASPQRGVIEDHLRQFPPDVLRHYYGHGVTRGDQLDHLTAAISILTNNAVQGGVARLEGSGYADAYTNGSFLAVSRRDDEMIDRDKNKAPALVSLGQNQYTGKEITAMKIHPGALVVNAEFYPIVPELRAMFPEANILYANELPDYIKEEEDKSMDPRLREGDKE